MYEYEPLMKEMQSQASAAGYKPYVALPKFAFDTPEPILIDHYVDESIKKLQEAGFTGDNMFVSAHSLGGVFAQKYVKKQPDVFKGQILMGSVMLRAPMSTATPAARCKHMDLFHTHKPG